MLNLREFDAFPNWSLALEFLKRSPVNFLLSRQLPPEDTDRHLARRIVLQGVMSPFCGFAVPEDCSREHIINLCSALVRQPDKKATAFPTVRSSNFVTFLNAFTQILNGKFELKEVAQAITDKTSELFDADGVSILLPLPDSNNFYFAVVTAEREDVKRRLEAIEVQGNKGITGWVVEHGRSILVNNENREVVYNPEIDQKTRFQTREVLASPILVGEKLIGVLQIVSKREGAFLRSDLQMVELTAAIIASFMDKARLYEKKLSFAKVEKEIEIAHELQMSMMPSLPFHFGPFRLVGESRPVSRVGGDFWDVIKLDKNERLLIIGDVSGHGMGAAMIMSAVRTASRALLPHICSPVDYVEHLNLLIYNEFGVNGHYATLIFCHLDLNHRSISYLRAGHEYPLLGKGDTINRIKEPGSLPIGLFPFRQDDVWKTLSMAEGEHLFLYTDGVLDGLSEDEPNMGQLMRDYPFEEALDNGCFFESLTEHLQWQHMDDATMLKLSFE